MNYLSKTLPEHGEGVKRESLLKASELIGWFADNRTDVFKAALKALGEKEMRDALNDLENNVKGWR